jgi:hypothetical protein
MDVDVPAWIAVQERTFTRWCVMELAPHCTGGSRLLNRCNEYLGHAWLRIDSLDEFHDGAKLCALLEVLGSTKVKYKQQPRNRMEMLANANAALTFFKEYTGERLLIGPEDIVDKNKKLMLGFIWSVILRWQVSAIRMGCCG